MKELRGRVNHFLRQSKNLVQQYSVKRGKGQNHMDQGKQDSYHMHKTQKLQIVLPAISESGGCRKHLDYWTFDNQ